jgi:hypothetical protein
MSHMTIREALATREVRYEGKSEECLTQDARGDILRLLNVLTDIEMPSNDQVRMIKELAKAYNCLLGHDWSVTADTAETVRSNAKTAAADKLKGELDVAWTAFLDAKDSGKDASAPLARLFDAHTKLAAKVMEFCTTAAEREVIAAKK